MINQTLLNNWNGASFGVTVQFLAGKTGEWHVYDPYFFLRRELDVTRDTWQAAKQRGEIRHCKIYRGRFLDYVVRKEFNTFQEWLTDAGGRIEDVLFGENRIRDMEWQWVGNVHTRVPKTPKYVELMVLLRHLGYVPPPPPLEIPQPETELEEVTRMMGHLLAERDLTMDNVWVIADGVPTRWADFMH